MQHQKRFTLRDPSTNATCGVTTPSPFLRRKKSQMSPLPPLSQQPLENSHSKRPSHLMTHDPCVQEMLDQPTQATQAVYDLRPQCRAAPSATPTIRPSPTILPRSKPTQNFTPTILPTSKPTKNVTLPVGPAYIQPDYDEHDDHCNPRPDSPPIPRDAI